ncbi:MAG: hypothetical protein HY676_00590, partial [Chloroflexi bacterium]|nr:hypothetical protein [Chloroflexota bacterium]
PLPGPAPSSTYTDAEWAQIVKAAKSEGKVMLYSNPTFISWKQQVIRDGMKETYGIDVEFLIGSAAVTAERVKSEDRAGIRIADFVNGTAPISELEKKGYFKPINNLPTLKDANNPDVWIYNPLITPSFVFHPAIWNAGSADFEYNTRVVPPERVPVKITDLLDPWWKTAKICMHDPFTSSGGSDYSIWDAARPLGYPDWLLDFFYDLTNKDSGRMYYFLIGTPDPWPTGECGLQWHGWSSTLQKETVVFDKVTWIEGGSFDPPFAQGVGGLSGGVLKTAPHPNAALVMINWFLSQEGQAKYANAEKIVSPARRDVPDPIEKEYWPKTLRTHYWVSDIENIFWYNYLYGLKINYKMQKEGMSKAAWLKAVKDASLAYWGQWPPPPVEVVPIPQD